MKPVYVADLAAQEGQTITSFFLVQSRSVRSTREGNPYLALRLADRTGTVEGRMWEGVEEVEGEFDPDDVVKVEAVVEPYRGRPQLKIRRLRRATEDEVEPADYLPATQADVEALYGELLETARSVENQYLRELLVAAVTDDEITPRLKRAPGAKVMHHAYIGGLLEHIVSLCRLCRLTAQNYPEVDLDLLLTGAILHDMGKVYELSYERSFDYTTEGRLLGHIAIALEWLGRKMDAIAGFPAKLRLLLQHLLLSHHGRLEFGSPVTPRFREAVMLHYLDDLDSKMEAVRAELAAAETSGQSGDWTEWSRALERPLLRQEKFLAEKLAEAPPAETLFDTGPAKK